MLNMSKKESAQVYVVEKKGLCGRGKLTDTTIDRLQNYYGIAIRSNKNKLEDMKSAV